MPDMPWEILGKAGSVFGVVMFVLWLYNRREKRRKRAMEFADIMRDWGLKWFAEGYQMYAVGDYSGIAYKLREVVGAIRSDEVILGKLDEVFWKVLERYKEMPDKADKVRQVLATVEAKKAGK